MTETADEESLLRSDLDESRAESERLTVRVIQQEADLSRMHLDMIESEEQLTARVIQQEADISGMHLDMIESEEETRAGMDGLQQVITDLMEAQQTLVERSPAQAPPPPVPTSSMELSASHMTPLAAVRTTQAVLASPGLRLAASKLREMSRLDPSGPPTAMLESPGLVPPPPQLLRPAAFPMAMAPIPVAIGVVASPVQSPWKVRTPPQEKVVPAAVSPAKQTPRSAIASFAAATAPLAATATEREEDTQSSSVRVREQPKKGTPRTAISSFLNASSASAADLSMQDIEPLPDALTLAAEPTQTELLAEQLAAEKTQTAPPSPGGVREEETPPVSALIAHFDGEEDEPEFVSPPAPADEEDTPVADDEPPAVVDEEEKAEPLKMSTNVENRIRRSRWGPKPPVGPPPGPLVGQARTVTQAIALEQAAVNSPGWTDWMDASTSSGSVHAGGGAAAGDSGAVFDASAWFSADGNASTGGATPADWMDEASVSDRSVLPLPSAMDESGWQDASAVGGLAKVSDAPDALAMAKEQLAKLRTVVHEHETVREALSTPPSSGRQAAVGVGSGSGFNLNELSQSQSNAVASAKFHPGGGKATKPKAIPAGAAGGGSASSRRASAEKKKTRMPKSKIPKKKAPSIGGGAFGAVRPR